MSNQAILRAVTLPQPAFSFDALSGCRCLTVQANEKLSKLGDKDIEVKYADVILYKGVVTDMSFLFYKNEIPAGS